MTAAVTFDFHNTIAHCASWFAVEVHDLVGSYLERHFAVRDLPLPEEVSALANLHYRRLRTGIHAHGHELPADRCIITIMEHLGLEVDPAEVETLLNDLMRATQVDVRPVTGAIETITELADAGIPLGVVSSAVFHPFLEWTLEDFGIRDAFTTVITSASAGYYKTRPEIYWTALRSLQADPAKSVHVGDSIKFDVGGAQRAGMTTVWLDPDNKPGPHPFEPTATVSTLTGSRAVITDLLAGLR